MNTFIVFLASAFIGINGAMKIDANSGTVISIAKLLPLANDIDLIKFSGKHPKISLLGDAIPGGPYRVGDLKSTMDLWEPDYDDDGNIISYTDQGAAGGVYDCQAITGYRYQAYQDYSCIPPSSGWSFWP